MGLANGTTTMRKAMRVTTLFTGAAAVAAWGPAAMAATGHAEHTAGAMHTVTTRPGGTVRPGNRISGSIQASTQCTHSHWVHLDVAGAKTCYGFQGVWQFRRDPTDECGGTNYGNLFVYNTGLSAVFGPGKTYRTFSFSPSRLLITGWSGNDKCGPFPG
jgi:hypothetical protein